MSDLSKLPAPLTAPDTDLRGYQFMPLHGDILFRSAFNVRASDAEFRAALNLWWSAWWESPAASLPNNERDLARLAGLPDLRKWRKVRELVMEKWVLCSDDRWYLPFLADLSTDAYAKRRSATTKGRNGAKKRWGINGHAHASANATANAPAIVTHSTGNAPAKESDSTGNSNRSEVNNPLPPSSKSTSKPMVQTIKVSKTERLIEEQRAAASRATPPPPGFMDAWKKPPDHFDTITSKDTPQPPPAAQPSQVRDDFDT